MSTKTVDVPIKNEERKVNEKYKWVVYNKDKNKKTAAIAMQRITWKQIAETWKTGRPI